MDKNVLLSKISANPTESTWSQAYSTLNLYIVLSIKSAEETEKGVVAEGRELFERLQREYFSLDEKNLKNIKESVEAALDAQVKKENVSLVLTTINEDVLYIVIAYAGHVILKRGEKIGAIASGEEGIVSAFSGEIQNDDVIILETSDFATKVPTAKLQEVLKEQSEEVSESLAPLVHEEATGTEAAIILQYKKPEEEQPVTLSGIGETEEKTEDTSDNDAGSFTEEELKHPAEEKHEAVAEEPVPVHHRNSGLLKKGGRNKIIVIAIVLLVIILGGSILFENSRREAKAQEAQLQQVLGPAQQKYDEANSMISLNKGLALDEFNSLKETLDSEQSKIKEGTPQRKKFDEFIGKVEQKIGELSSGSTLAGQKVIYDKSANLVTFKNDQLAVVASDGKITLLDSDGSAKDDYETKNGSTEAVTGNDAGSIFVLGASGITQTTDTGTTTTAVKSDNADGVVALDTFGANLYGLTKTGINKYAGSSFSKSDYLTGDDDLSDATSFAIDSSIYVLDDGKIKKFTKGAEDSFNVSGLTKDLSDDAQLFTGADYEDLYALDSSNNRIVSISKSDGALKNQYVSKELSGATSFAVDETGKKIYVIISSKLYSFDL